MLVLQHLRSNEGSETLERGVQLVIAFVVASILVTLFIYACIYKVDPWGNSKTSGWFDQGIEQKSIENGQFADRSGEYEAYNINKDQEDHEDSHRKRANASVVLPSTN